MKGSPSIGSNDTMESELNDIPSKTMCYQPMFAINASALLT